MTLREKKKRRKEENQTQITETIKNGKWDADNKKRDNVRQGRQGKRRRRRVKENETPC